MRLFEIPELPEGDRLSFHLIENWGDPFYFGLNGIEIFNDHGVRVNIVKVWRLFYLIILFQKIQTNATESTAIENLLNDNYTTKDANQLWTAKYNSDEPITIDIDLSKRQNIAMIRIWVSLVFLYLLFF